MVREKQEDDEKDSRARLEGAARGWSNVTPGQKQGPGAGLGGEAPKKWSNTAVPEVGNVQQAGVAVQTPYADEAEVQRFQQLLAADGTAEVQNSQQPPPEKQATNPPSVAPEVPPFAAENTAEGSTVLDPPFEEDSHGEAVVQHPQQPPLEEHSANPPFDKTPEVPLSNPSNSEEDPTQTPTPLDPLFEEEADDGTTTLTPDTKDPPSTKAPRTAEIQHPQQQDPPDETLKGLSSSSSPEGDFEEDPTLVDFNPLFSTQYEDGDTTLVADIDAPESISDAHKQVGSGKETLRQHTDNENPHDPSTGYAKGAATAGGDLVGAWEGFMGTQRQEQPCVTTITAGLGGGDGDREGEGVLQGKANGAKRCQKDGDDELRRKFVVTSALVGYSDSEDEDEDEF